MTMTAGYERIWQTIIKVSICMLARTRTSGGNVRARPVEASPEAIEWRSGHLRAVRDLSRDIRLFEIEPAGDFVPPTPGGHFNIGVQINGRPDVRNYSAVVFGTDGLYRIAVKSLLESRGGSAYMWSLSPGAQLTISTAGNHFELSQFG
jgi:ferredoxin-NADP reductase